MEVITDKPALERKTKNSNILSRLENLLTQTNESFIEMLDNLLNLDVSKRWDINTAVNSTCLRDGMGALHLIQDTETSRTLSLWRVQELQQQQLMRAD